MQLTVRNVTRRYITPAERVDALRGVTLDIRPGELVAVRGASGSGKTTLINVLAGIDVPDSGQVMFGDVVVSSLPAQERADFRLRTFGLVFQDDNLIAELTALENVALPLIASGRSARDAESLAGQALESVGIGGLATRLPREMSGGQRQRVGIARAVAKDTRVILADEPTGSLDRKTSLQIFETVRQLCDMGATAVIATHDDAAQSFATRTVTMTDGSLVGDAR